MRRFSIGAVSTMTSHVPIYCLRDFDSTVAAESARALQVAGAGVAVEVDVPGSWLEKPLSRFANI